MGELGEPSDDQRARRVQLAIGIIDAIRNEGMWIKLLMTPNFCKHIGVNEISEVECAIIALAQEVKMLSDTLQTARVIAQHWRDQGGINGAMLDQLAEEL